MLRGHLRVTSGLCDRRPQPTTSVLRERRGCTTSVRHMVRGRRCAWTESDIGSRSTRACRWVVKMCVRGSQLFGGDQNGQASTPGGRRDLAKGQLFGADSKLGNVSRSEASVSGLSNRSNEWPDGWCSKEPRLSRHRSSGQCRWQGEREHLETSVSNRAVVRSRARWVASRRR